MEDMQDLYWQFKEAQGPSGAVLILSGGVCNKAAEAEGVRLIEEGRKWMGR